MAHYSGHPTRLNRDLAHPFGSEGYAKEELRAEIASLMVGDQLGIGHDPGQHSAYVKSWVKVLREDPKEILRAARDADKIAPYVLDLDKERAPLAKASQVIEAQRAEPVLQPASEAQRLGTDGRRAAAARER